LNVVFAHGATRWLDDMGTGSYVDSSLHWYRSTLAHNAPLVDGRSQRRVDGVLDAYEEDGVAGVVSAHAAIALGVVATRTITVEGERLLDELTWQSDRSVRVELPLHVDVALLDDGVRFAAMPLDGGSGIEDGFAFVSDSEAATLAANVAYRCQASDGPTYASIPLTIVADQPFQLWRCRAPGAPGQPVRRFVVLRSIGTEGRFRIAWNGAVMPSESGDPKDLPGRLPAGRSSIRHGGIGDPSTARLRRSARDDSGGEGLRRFARDDSGGEGLRRSARDDSGGEGLRRFARDDSGGEDPRGFARGDAGIVLVRGQPVELSMGETHYRRSEEDWHAANAPVATVSLRWDGRLIDVRVRVERVERSFTPPDAINLLDNEAADINGAGVQLYLSLDNARALGVMLVPESGSTRVRVRPIDGWSDPLGLLQVGDAGWGEWGDGYEIAVTLAGVDRDAADAGFDLIVNEKPTGRERRRGQLVLSGGASDFVYLRGDRHERSRLIPLKLSNG
jgi:hypothetical protein